jgi:uncharacterized protein YndB with AHSA1/START domain
MPSATGSIVVHRPIQQVFDFFTTPSNDPRWRSHVKEISASGPLGPGTVVRQVVAGPGGRGIPASLRVVAFESPSRYSFIVTEGPARPEGEFRFTSVEGGTEVSLTLRAELRGLRGLLLSRPVQHSMDGEVAALDRARRLIEAG